MAVKKTTSEAPKKTTKKTSPASHAEIKKRAEAIYHERVAKNLPGTEEGDWLEAEKQISAHKS
jgi:hypothetical protein